jgi:hypothetical protein
LQKVNGACRKLAALEGKVSLQEVRDACRSYALLALLAGKRSCLQKSRDACRNSAMLAGNLQRLQDAG